MTTTPTTDAAAEDARKLTKKAFREHLNAKYPITERERYRVNGGPMRGATVRPYGDYLYAQDRDKFNAEYSEWAWEQHHAIDGRLTNCNKDRA